MSHTTLPSDINVKFLDTEEGYSSKFIYPGGVSGPTIGRGIDIGNLDSSTLNIMFEGVDAPTLSIIKTGYGLKSGAAKAWVKNNKVGLPKEILERANIYICGVFWGNIMLRYPGIDTAPAGVKTAVFSCCYNRGYRNKDLVPFIGFIAKKDWKSIADMLWRMQQDHPLPGIRTRRRREASLIYNELKASPKP
jgi:GH24 family phage-related lysozyme (muramidase)